MRASSIPAAVTLALLSLATAPANAETTYVTGDRMLDVETGRYIASPLIAIEDGKIVSVTSGGPRPKGPK